MSQRTTHPISYYWHTRWTTRDEQILDARIGDPASQAKWEAYSLLLACVKWLPAMAQSNSSINFVGDALGVLCDALAFRAKEPMLNKIMGELALRFAPLGLELAVTHCWSEWNEICDRLSRDDASVRLDSRLASATVTTDSRPQWSLLE
jgi:hypothetical protein